jgi:phosphohistidine phosphatase
MADFDRPLNRRGHSEAEAIARRLIELRLVPKLMLVSPARRARQTAEVIVRELGTPARALRTEESLYLAPATEILRLVRSTGPRISHLMVVGHNPGITEVSNLLAPTSRIGDMTTGAMCSMTFDARSWTEVGAETLRDVRSEAPPARLFALWA